jgi:hypothetical protein
LRDATLTLEQVYGAITFHLGNKDEVGRDIAERETEEDAQRISPNTPDAKEKFERMRRQMTSQRP